MKKPEACPACGNTTSGPRRDYRAADGFVYSYRVCPGCGLQGIDPIPSPEVLRDAYTERYYGGGTTKFARPLERIRNAFSRMRAWRVRRASGLSAGSVLDVGCGNGKFLELMSRAGWRISGTEIAGRAYERALQVPGIQLHPAQDGQPLPLQDESADVITVWHVLEHVADPKALLADCRRVLKKGGLLLIEVPNVSSWQARWSGGKWFHLDPPRHLYQFTPESLLLMLARAGFEGMRVKTLSLEMGVYGFAQSLMNMLLPRRDALYASLIRAGSDRRLMRMPVGSALLFAAVLVPSLILAILEGICGSGAVLRITCRPAAVSKPSPS